MLRAPSPDLLAPGDLGPPVEDDQVRLLHPRRVGVAPGLFQPRGERLLQGGVADLQLDHPALHPTWVAPDHAEVGAPPPQPILAVDASTAVDDALQEGLELMMEAAMKKDDRPIL